MEYSQMTSVAADTNDPRAGLRAVASLRALAETLELRQVEAAARAGMSWQCIADALGVTRRAARKRFAQKIDQSITVPRRNR